MLKELIDTLPASYSSYIWSYRLSGNVLEITVPREYTIERENYRAAVITTGQVLKALSIQLEKTGISYHIQTFPSIENPKIIGAIRLDEFENTKTSDSRNKPDSSETLSMQQHIQNMTDEYHLKLTKITKPELLNSVVDSMTNHSDVYAVTSPLDNPFTWIKVGYWIETLTHNKTSDAAYTVDFLNNIPEPRKNIKNLVGLNRKTYLQAFLAM